MDIGIKLLPVMWVFSLHSKIHALFMKYKMAQAHSVMHSYKYPSLFPVLFLQPFMSLFNSKDFSFTCLHPFFNCFQHIPCLLHDPFSPLNPFSKLKELTHVGQCTQYINVLCSACHSPNCNSYRV